jgi:hypothetical protein
MVRRWMIEDDHLMLDTGKYRGEEVPEYLINPIE